MNQTLTAVEARLVEDTIVEHSLRADQAEAGARREALTVLRRDASLRYLQRPSKADLAECDRYTELIEALDAEAYKAAAAPRLDGIHHRTVAQDWYHG